MKPLPALFLTGCVYSFLIWAYIAFRIILGGFPMSDSFIYDIPISFWQLALGAFTASAVCCLGFLISRE